MNRRRILLIAVAAAAVFALTIFLTQTRFIQEVLAPPIYIIFVIITTFFDSLPQLLFWFVFVLIALQLLLTGLLRYVVAWLGQRRYGKPIRTEVTIGAVEKYTRWIEQESQGAFFKWRLRQRVMELGLRIIGRNEPIPLRELEESLDENTLKLPDGVVSYLNETFTAREENRKPQGKSFLPRSKQKDNHADLKAMLDYMEEVLEI